MTEIREGVGKLFPKALKRKQKLKSKSCSEAFTQGLAHRKPWRKAAATAVNHCCWGQVAELGHPGDHSGLCYSDFHWAVSCGALADKWIWPP